MPDLQATYEELKSQGVVVLGVDFQEDRATVARVAKEAGLTFPILLDMDGQVGVRYRVDVTGHPSNFFVDKSGVIIGSRVGYTDKPGLMSKLRPALD